MALPPTIIFSDVPPKTFVGINLTSFNSSPKFLGITNIPSGPLFIYTGTDASLSIRHGLWLTIQSTTSVTQIITLKWNKQLEHLERVENGDEQTKDLARRLPTLQNKGLVDYAALRDAGVKLQNEQANQSNGVNDEPDEDEEDTTKTWPQLTKYITPLLLTRTLSSEKTSSSWELTSISSAPSDTEHIPGLSSDESRSALEPLQTLNVLPIDLKHTWSEEAIGRIRTDMARDRSWYLGHLISQLRLSEASQQGKLSQAQAASELLGELQFCFLMVLCLANYSCMEQWKRLLSVFFTCRAALIEVEGFFVEVLTVLRLQLGRVEDVEGGLFELADESGSAWLRKLLKTFRANLEEAHADAEHDGSEDPGKKLNDALDELEKWLREKYSWEDEKHMLRKGMVQLEDGDMVEIQADDLDEDEETGEYAPVVVDTGLAYSGSLDDNNEKPNS